MMRFVLLFILMLNVITPLLAGDYGPPVPQSFAPTPTHHGNRNMGMEHHSQRYAHQLHGPISHPPQPLKKAIQPQLGASESGKVVEPQIPMDLEVASELQGENDVPFPNMPSSIVTVGRASSYMPQMPQMPQIPQMAYYPMASYQQYPQYQQSSQYTPQMSYTPPSPSPLSSSTHAPSPKLQSILSKGMDSQTLALQLSAGQVHPATPSNLSPGSQQLSQTLAQNLQDRLHGIRGMSPHDMRQLRFLHKDLTPPITQYLRQ